LKGNTGQEGPQGPIGPQGPSGDRTFIIFTTSETVNNNDYVGCGNSSSNILRNSILVPNNCVINKIAFTIRELSQNNEYSATLYINGLQSALNAVIIDGSSQFQIISNANINLTQLDEISVRIQTNGGALAKGVSVSLLVTII
jgi:hypothetical protein